MRVMLVKLGIVLLLTGVASIGCAQAESASMGAKALSYDAAMKLAADAARARKYSEAAALYEQAVLINPTVPDTWATLGLTHYLAKEYPQAIKAYERALELGAGYPWSSTYDIACCYALMGRKDEAIASLEKSLQQGFRDLEHAQTDEDFASIRDDQRYRDLVLLADTTKMSRDEGYRYDLKLFAHELLRLHFAPYQLHSKEEFENYIAKLDADIPKLTRNQIAVRMLQLGAMLGDGHTGMRLGAGPAPKLLPLQFYLFADGAYVTAAGPAYGDLVGKRILKIGSSSLDEALKAVDPLIGRENDMWFKERAPSFLIRAEVLNGLGITPTDAEVAVTVEGENGPITKTVQTGSDTPQKAWIFARPRGENDPAYVKRMDENYWYEYDEASKTVYFQYNRVANGPKLPLARFCEDMFTFIDGHDVQRMVVDLRWNNGGNNFLNQPLISGLMKTSKINERGKLFVIIGRDTFSAAQCCTTQIERYTRALFVGEPTGSAPNFIGETIPIKLPYSGWNGSVSDLYWQNSVAMDHRIWIAPDLYAPPSFALYRSNRDPAMEAINAYKGG